MLKMAHNEIDSFILKFRNLWQAGWNAKLSLESISGKIEVNLSVELGDAPVCQRPKTSPSRQRRRARRAAARDVGNTAVSDGDSVAHDAGKVAEQENLETIAVDASSVSEENSIAEKSNDEGTEKTPKDFPLQDELCSDQVYLNNVDDDDTPVEKIMLEAKCQEVELEEEYVKDHLEYNLKILGINIIEANMNKSESGVIKSCSIIVEPTPKKIIKQLSLSLKNWYLKHCL